jgi:hypothetical protein
VVSKENIKVLCKGQYCVIKDVVDKHGKPQLAKRELRVGPCSFFLHPGTIMAVNTEVSVILYHTAFSV